MQNGMNKLKKIVCLALAVLMATSVCAMFLSCEKRPSGKLLATYEGGKVYESDVADWQNFFRIENVQEIYDAEDPQAKIAEVDDNTTSFYVNLKAFKKLLEDKGLATISETAIKKYAEEIVLPAIEIKYEKNGGYEFWKKSYGVSDNFIYDYAEEQLVTSYLKEYVMDKYGVTDDMVKEYWEAHSYKYLVVPSYVFDVIMVSVADADKSNVDAWEAAKAEAQGYIDRIKAGEDFSDVKADAIQKSKNVDSATAFSVKDSVPFKSCEGFEDEEENLAAINEYIDAVAKTYNIKLVEYAPADGDEMEFELWYGYCNMLNEFYTKNALLSLDIDETISAPIRHIEGYEIIKLLEKSDKTEFQRPENNKAIYDDIYQTIYEDLWDNGNGESVDKFEKQLEEDYNIKIVYSYASNNT